MKKQKNKPNIIMIITHDTGNYFGCYGASIETPNIDNLAERGMLFTNHFCTAPQCSPSRGSILTGVMPHNNGLMGLLNEGWNLSNEVETIPKILLENGYSTHLIGLQHEKIDAKKLGYQFVSDRSEFPYFAENITPRVINFIQAVEEGEIKTPFFCSIGFFETHRPFIPSSTELVTPVEKVKVPPYLPDSTEVRADLAEFEASVRLVDNEVGKIVEALSKTSFFQNTIILFTVDHGWAFPRAKCTLYDPGIKTALIIYWPKEIQSKIIYSELTSNVDIFPSILEMVGVEFPQKVSVHGYSFTPIIFNRKSKQREYIFSELTFHDIGYNPVRCIRSKRWKYIKNFTPINTLFEIPNDVSLTASGKQYIQHNPNYNQQRPSEELYDLLEDPNEFRNLAKHAEYLEIRNQLNKTLMKWLRDTNDPILEGPMQEPPKPEQLTW